MADQPRNRANVVVGGILAVVVIVAMAAMALTSASLGDAHGSGASALVAVVHDASGGRYELPLAEDAELPVETELGVNVVEVRDGAVCVREADCGNQACVHQGWIDAPGRQIICLPHKLWIEIVASGDPDGEMDVGSVAGDAEEGLDAVAS